MPPSKRLASATTSPRPTKRHAPPLTHLDLLPSDLQRRISDILLHACPTPDALNLALVSPSQRAAVLASLSHTLTLSGDLLLHLPQWLSLFQSTLRHLSIGHVSVFTQPTRAAILSHLASPALHTLRTFDDPPVLAALHASHLRQLELRITSRASHAPILAALRKLALTRLHLLSYTRFASECPFDARDPSALLVELPHACPRLHALTLSCSLTQHTHEHTGDPLWPLLHRFKELREVDVQATPPEDVLPLLRRLQSVRVTSRLLWASNKPNAASLNALEVAVTLGANVTHLLTQEVLTAPQIRRLAGCQGLCVVNVRVEEAEDYALVDMVKMLPRLRALTIKWAQGRSPGELMWGANPQYRPCAEGVLEGIARNASGVRELALLEGSISAEQLERVLSMFGKRLTHFGTSVLGQPEMPCHRLELVLACLARYCSGLRSWELGINLLPSAYSVTEWGDCIVLKYRQRLRMALERLKRAAPFLCTAEFERQFVSFFGEGDSVGQPNARTT